MANFATLVLGADTTGLVKGRKEIEQTTQAANKNEQATGKMAAGFNKAAMAAAALGAAAVVAVGSLAFRGAIREAEQLERNMLRTNSIITATGGAAGRTANQLHQQARALALTTLASTEGVMKAQQTLLTFRNIRGEVFDDAIKGAMDLAAAMGTDLNSATLQLAKALEDPITGMSALTRSGTVFTDAQKEMVKGMVAAGDTAKAQQFILGELAAQYGGVAAKEAAGLAGAQDTLAQRQQEFLIALNDTLGLTAIATAANTAMAAGVLFLTDNVNELVGIIGAAAAAALIAYTPAIYGAVTATAAWVASLITLRGALLATGVGALVVGAGLLVGKFLDLVESAGGFGKAMGLLGNVAVEVWQRISNGADFVAQSVAAMAYNAQAAFLAGIRAMAGAWVEFTWTVAEGLNNLFGTNLQGASAAITGAFAETEFAAYSAAQAATAAASAAAEAFSAPLKSLDALSASVDETTDALSGAVDETSTLNDSLNDLDGAAGKAGKALEKVKTEAEAYNDALKDAALTAEDLGTAKANILTGGIDSVSNAFGDFVARGFKDFKGFAKSILSTFTGMLSQMIALAAKNQIMIGLGISAGGAGGAGAVAAGQPGGGGIVSGIIGKSLGGFVGTWGGTGGILGGLSGAVSGLTTGGIGGALSSIGTSLTGAFSGVAGFGAALGALAGPVALVVAAISFFKKKVTELDRGINFAAENMAITIEGYKKINTKRFWGLSSKDTEEAFDGYDEGIPPMVKAVNEVQQGIVDAAAALGIGAEAFDNFTYEFQSSFKDMTEDQIQAELAAKFRQLGHDFAVLIPGLEGLTKEGELASDTLYALVNSLNGVNATFEALGFSMLDATLEGAALAQSFVNIFGSMENLNTATTAYYQRFYSDAERTQYATAQMRRALADLGFVMPATTEGFRALVEQAERMGDLDTAGRLIAMSGAFAGVVDANDAAYNSAADDLRAAFEREMSATRDSFSLAIAGLQATLTDARERLATSRAIADALASALVGRVFPSVNAEREAQDRAANYLRSLIGVSRIEDRAALEDALRVVADPSADTYETLEDYRRDFNLTTGVIRQLEKTAGFTLDADEQAVALLEQQIADMQAQSDEQVALLQSQLDALIGIKEAMSLQEAIRNFEGMNGSNPAPSNFTTDQFGATTTAGQLADASNARAIQKIYQDVLNRSADAAGLQFYVDQARDNLSIMQIRDLISGSTEAQTGIMPSFAGGGFTGNGARSGGLDGRGGFAAVLHPNETVIDHTRGRSGNADLAAEMRQMRADLNKTNSILISVARNTGRTARDLNKWDNEGMPGTASGEVVTTEAVA